MIGSDAFYFKRRRRVMTVVSCGRVIIADKVEIGASCTIDKGVSGDTVIGEGTKMDNQVHVGHDTGLERIVFAAQVGIAGVVNIEDDVILWGQVGVQKDLTIGKGAVVLGNPVYQNHWKAVKHISVVLHKRPVKMRELLC